MKFSFNCKTQIPGTEADPKRYKSATPEIDIDLQTSVDLSPEEFAHVVSTGKENLSNILSFVKEIGPVVRDGIFEMKKLDSECEDQRIAEHSSEITELRSSVSDMSLTISHLRSEIRTFTSDVTQALQKHAIPVKEGNFFTWNFLKRSRW